MRRDTQLVAALTALLAIRLIAGALLPLSADEAYYWLWSRHLAAGYYDHPPAIAWLIRFGTFLFGDTPFGVRIGGILTSFAASWFVWRSAAIVLDDEKAGALACLFFNLTLMVTVESLAATPDAPLIFAGAAFAFSLAKVAETGRGSWWLAAGVAAGMGLLSKYSMLFLGFGALVWLATPPMRRWLVSFWPYLGGALAAAIFLPNVLWNASHDWATFVFQFGRVSEGHFTLKFIAEFIGAQAILATPFILILAAMGLSVPWHDKRRVLVAALVWPSIAYFLWHSLHDRVQGNWPCYLYPLLAVAAADAALRTDWKRWRAPLARWSARLAVPVAAVMLIAGYAQALLGVVPMGRKDPLARLLAVGLPEVVTRIETLRTATGADAVLTTDYATASWLAFYGTAKIVDVGEDYRWPDAPVYAARGPALYVVEPRKDRRELLTTMYENVTVVTQIERLRKGIPIARYVVYRVSGPKAPAAGRLL